jgi:hypothetical protein
MSSSGLRLGALVLLLLLAGCSGGDGADATRPSASASPTKNPLIGGPAPDSALAPGPSGPSGTDPQVLLRPGGDLDRLAGKVSMDLGRLQSLHVEQRNREDSVVRFSIDVDDTGRCSGEIVEGGVRYRFVTTSDGRVLATTDQGAAGERLEGRWVEAPPKPPVDACLGGPESVALSGSGLDSRWMIADAERVGEERLAGRPVVHFRKSQQGLTVDSWIAADGPAARLMKMTTRHRDGYDVTAVFSEFGSAGPVTAEPPADQVVSSTRAS